MATVLEMTVTLTRRLGDVNKNAEKAGSITSGRTPALRPPTDRLLHLAWPQHRDDGQNRCPCLEETWRGRRCFERLSVPVTVAWMTDLDQERESGVMRVVDMSNSDGTGLAAGSMNVDGAANDRR